MAAGAGGLGLNQARVIEYLIGDDMRLLLLRTLPRCGRNLAKISGSGFRRFEKIAASASMRAVQL